MRVARIQTSTGPRYAVARPAAEGEPEWAVVEDPFAEQILFTGERAPIRGTALLAPVAPTVVIGIAHNKNLNDHHLPIQAWHKSVRSITGPGTEVPIRSDIGGVTIEGELALVIGRPAYRLSTENALEAVFGYTIANDVTNVDQVAVDERFFQVKSGRGYAPLGPWIETQVENPDAVPITVAINGVVLGQSGTQHLPSTVAECLVYVTQWLELGPGDVVLTGAPRTYFPAAVGDRVQITLAGIGTLENTIVAEQAHD